MRLLRALLAAMKLLQERTRNSPDQMRMPAEKVHRTCHRSAKYVDIYTFYLRNGRRCNWPKRTLGKRAAAISAAGEAAPKEQIAATKRAAAEVAHEKRVTAMRATAKLPAGAIEVALGRQVVTVSRATSRHCACCYRDSDGSRGRRSGGLATGQ
jgi:hypothetical protein